MSSAMTTATPESTSYPFTSRYTAVELTEDAVGILDAYVSDAMTL